MALARVAFEWALLKLNATVQKEQLMEIKELIEAIAKALVDYPDQVAVRPVEGEQVTVLELRVHPSDLGKVIGKQGRTARSPWALPGCPRRTRSRTASNVRV
jgi:predicted RNA-binding protein YlqC (UPF0109 family)